MSELPKGWLSSKLNDVVVDHQPGFASGKKDVENGLKHLRMNNISVNGKLNLGLVRTVPQSLASQKHYLKKGDVLICTTNSGKLVGKCALFDIDGEFAFSNHLTRLRTNSAVCSKYLTYQLWLQWKQGAFEHKCKHWVNQSTLPKAELLATEFVVAPLNEQRRIVAKLEKLLSRVDSAQARLATVPRILKRFRQSVLAAGYSGRLTADWRFADPIPKSAHDRLAAIKAARLAVAKNESEITRVSKFFEELQVDSNGESPGGWLRLKAEIVCNFITKGTTPKTDLISAAGEVPFLKVQHIVDNKLDFWSLPCFVPKSIHNGFLQRSKVYPGDVLMNIVGPPLNKVAIVPSDFPEWNINQALAIFRPVDGLEPEYLLSVLSHEGTLEHILMETRGIVGQSNISLDQCRNLTIPVPPRAEQQEIVRRVEALFKTADALEVRYYKAKAHIDKLKQSILAKAFRGELVPQDPNDEPASVLLQRIQKSRDEYSLARSDSKKNQSS